eukprot:2982401-Amphidinium_carterae.1
MHLLWHKPGRAQLLALRAGHLSITVLHIYGYAADLQRTTELLGCGLEQMHKYQTNYAMVVGDLNGEAYDFEALLGLADAGWVRLH